MHKCKSPLESFSHGLDLKHKDKDYFTWRLFPYSMINYNEKLNLIQSFFYFERRHLTNFLDLFGVAKEEPGLEVNFFGKSGRKN